ncbi:hypothetical protein GCM10022280_16540 [Sphingomonas swuensis]|uniref:Transglutaminase-like domain-containing protein n=2 Tax=Sphingomonas swuensis TaxID=977800 RepID=A0ABP7SYJ8_9SPHN
MPRIQESFDPFLSGISSVDEIMSVLATVDPTATNLQRLDQADALLRRRFVHGYSYLTFDQNWAGAALRLFWDDLASPVRADDILKFRRGACSQQALVFQEISRRLGFDYATVSIPGHYAAAARIDGKWYVYDANREVLARRYPFEWIATGDPRLSSIYSPELAAQLIDDGRNGRIRLRDVNRNSAENAALLQSATDLFSRFGWLVVLALCAALEAGSRLARLRIRLEAAEQAVHSLSAADEIASNLIFFPPPLEQRGRRLHAIDRADALA